MMLPSSVILCLLVNLFWISATANGEEYFPSYVNKPSFVRVRYGEAVVLKPFGYSCRQGSECINLSECEVLKKFLNLRDINNIRKNICGFVGVRSKVCCPTPNTTPLLNSEAIPAPDLHTAGNNNGVSGESLLPTRCGRPSTADRIIGGGPARIGAYPWIVALGYSDLGVGNVKFLCAGSLINSRYVLTAAHCVNQRDLGQKTLSVLHLGDLDFSTEIDCQKLGRGGKRCQAKHIAAGFEEIVIHGQYDIRGSFSDDIALIRMNISVDFESAVASVEPVCLPEKEDVSISSLIEEKSPVAAGWGLTEYGNYSNILLRVSVQVKNADECRQKYGDNFVSKQLCVGGSSKSDTCSGDSGGPLVISGENGPPFYQIGIVSYGPFPCAHKGFPGVYTSVADYRDWIIDNLKP